MVQIVIDGTAREILLGENTKLAALSANAAAASAADAEAAATSLTGLFDTTKDNLDVAFTFLDSTGKEVAGIGADSAWLGRLRLALDDAGIAGGLTLTESADGALTLSLTGFGSTGVLTAPSGAAIDATLNNLDVALWILDSAGKVLFELGTDGTMNGVDNSAVAANTAALAALAGTRTDAATRIAETLTVYGAPKAAAFGMETLRNTRLKLARLKAGTASTRFVMNVGQDSYSQSPGGWSRKFATRMQGLFSDGGCGWIGFGGIGASPNDNIRAAVTVARTGFLRNQTLAVFSTHSPDLGFAYSSTSGDTIVTVIPSGAAYTGINLWFEKTASGACTVSINGSSPQSVNCAGSGLGYVALTNVVTTGAAQTITITNSASADVRLCGLQPISAADGVQINKIAAAGSQISTWTGADATSRSLWMGQMTADLWVWMGGANEKQANISASTYAASVSSWIDTIRAAQPETDILIAVGADITAGSGDMLAYQAALADVAWQKQVAFRNFQRNFGRALANYNDANAYLKLLNADGIHPSDIGYEIIADAFSADIIPAY